jgi:uncharacterized protein (TIGR02453 family)
MPDKSIFAFLKAIDRNNNREWFAVHKKEYEEVKSRFDLFVTQVIRETARFDPSVRFLVPADCTYRIYRDTRFSPDKTPYKTHLGAYLVAGGKKSNLAGYYVHIEPGNCLAGGGIYMPPSDILKAVRHEIFDNYDDFKKIIGSASFKKHFGTFSGDQLKSMPAGYSKEFPGAEWLKFKYYTVIETFDDKTVQSPDFIKILLASFKAMVPVNRFLNEAIKGI